MANARFAILVVAMAISGNGWCGEGDAGDAFTIRTERGAFGCKDVKEGTEVLGAIRASGGGRNAKDRKAIIEKSVLREAFKKGRCVWFEAAERVTPIGGPNPVWGGTPLAKTEWFFVRRDDKGTITTPDSTSEEYWVAASDLDPAGVAEW